MKYVLTRFGIEKKFLSTNLETNCVIGKEDSIDGTTDGPENPNDGDSVQQCLHNSFKIQIKVKASSNTFKILL